MKKNLETVNPSPGSSSDERLGRQTFGVIVVTLLIAIAVGSLVTNLLWPEHAFLLAIVIIVGVILLLVLMAFLLSTIPWNEPYKRSTSQEVLFGVSFLLTICQLAVAPSMVFSAIVIGVGTPTSATVVTRYSWYRDIEWGTDYYITYQFEAIREDGTRHTQQKSEQVTQYLYSSLRNGASVSVHYFPRLPFIATLDDDGFKPMSYLIGITLWVVAVICFGNVHVKKAV